MIQILSCLSLDETGLYTVLSRSTGITMAIGDDTTSLHNNESSAHSSNNSSHQVVLDSESCNSEHEPTKSYLSNFFDNTAQQLKALSIDEEKSWTTLDSVHSKSSVSTSNTPNGSNSNLLTVEQGIKSFDDSCASFASFGGSSDSDLLSNSESDLLTEKANFTRLNDDDEALLSSQRRNRMLQLPSYGSRCNSNYLTTPLAPLSEPIVEEDDL